MMAEMGKGLEVRAPVTRRSNVRTEVDQETPQS
jgi:hypothetical protein